MLSLRPAFSLLEIIFALGIFAVLLGVTVPALQRVEADSRVRLAADQFVQALRHAKTYAQTGQAGTSWGVEFTTGTLFSGKSYSSRDSTKDEQYPLPVSVIATTSLYKSNETFISFSCGNGLPSASGSVRITSDLTEGYRTIVVDRNGFISTLSGELSSTVSSVAGDDGIVPLRILDSTGACLY